MSKKQSPGEALRQKMNELPLPDENESWQKMKALLDEKKKRRLFVFFKKEKMIGAVILLLLLCLWFHISPEKTKKAFNANEVSLHQAIEMQNENVGEDKEPVTNKAITEHKKALQNNNSVDHLSDKQAKNTKDVSSYRQSSLAHKNKAIKETEKLSAQKNNRFFTNQSTIANPVITADANKMISNKNNNRSASILTGTVKTYQGLNLTYDSTQSVAGITTEKLSFTIKNMDSNSESLIKKDSLQLASNTAMVNAAKANIIVKRHNPYFIDVGVGIKQSLPIGGQKFVSYNDTVKKTWLSDYIPFFYVRLEKKERWFAQGEFHYASPRLIKAITYYQKTTADYSHSNTTIEAYRLQKTWYTQVPLSLNIYFRPFWSVGTGAVYSRLNGALSKKEISINDALTGRQFSGVQTLPVKGFTDSFLYKTNISLLLQTDYQTRRWSFGLRYLHDIQPFLSYTFPDGKKKDKRNASLELMIRYRLFRSAKLQLGK